MASKGRTVCASIKIASRPLSPYTRQIHSRPGLAAQTSTTSSLAPRHQKICGVNINHLASVAKPFSTTTPVAVSKKRVSKKMVNGNEFILTLSCPDRAGIVHAVTGFLAQHNLNIVDSQQFGDATSKKFFMRVHFAPVEGSSEASTSAEDLRKSFEQTAQSMSMDFELSSVAQKPRVMIMVSKIGHCLNDLLFRQSISQLGIEVPLIISNHPDFEPLAATYKIPFHHLPVTAATKTEQEERILELVKEHKIDLIVLARYMQVLSPKLCSVMSGKIINIHHSFLPSFKGAKPYHQAYDRGVKIIGATAHFVTSDLDEGPIIEQNVVRVGHALSPKELTMEGSNVESNVLATAVKWVTEKRVLLNGHKTVVFN
ncbi:formyltetrahydrofolate deformylase [Phlyctema vagabunda]|uniref:Formyltetrahydrofolate deformylase n=1 Tax=Phlyctema vagabunda TaxID=108571 RepID=A0ABR4P317_9HELO